MSNKTYMVAHLVGNNKRNKIEHIIAVPANSLERPSVLITEDGRTWVWGGEYQYFPDTGFYLEVQPAYFSKRMMATLSRAVPTLERNSVI